MFTLPARTDLISVPVSAIPASKVSSIVNSWRAFRLRATVESSRMWMAPKDLLVMAAPRSEVGGRSPGGHPPEDRARTPALCGPAFELLNHPQGCPTRRPSPARWCSYAYCRSLHITSFRSAKPYLTSPIRARSEVRSVTRSEPDRLQQLDCAIECRVRAGSHGPG